MSAQSQAGRIQQVKEGCSTLMQQFILARSLHLALKPTLIHIRGISTHRSLHVVFLLIKFPSPRVIICIVYLPLSGCQCCSTKTLRLIVLLLQRPLETKQVRRIIQSRCSVRGNFGCPSNSHHRRLAVLVLVIVVSRHFKPS